MATATARKLLVILAAATARSFPLRCQAATAALPWDRTVTAMQDMLIGTVAPAIGLAFTGAGILYTLGGYDKEAGRLFGSVVGGRVALVIVHLLN